MHWKDLEESRRWKGLRVIVERGQLAERPPLGLTVVRPYLFRLALGTRPLLWGRLDGHGRNAWWLLSGERLSPGAIPPLRFERARSVKAETGTDAWWSAWARHFATALAASPSTPLHPGCWHLVPARHLQQAPQPGGAARWCPAFSLEAFPRLRAQPAQGFDGWRPHTFELLALRSLSAPDTGRVKAFRKLAREGRLPPLLLLFIAPLERYVLLDGHERLLAALEEQVRPEALRLALTHTRTWAPDVRHQEVLERAASAALESGAPLNERSRTGLNRALVRAFTELRVLSAGVREGHWRHRVPSSAHLSGPGETRWCERL